MAVLAYNMRDGEMETGRSLDPSTNQSNCIVESQVLMRDSVQKTKADGF